MGAQEAMVRMQIRVNKEGVRVAFKTESTLMKVLGVLLFFNKGFMTRFTTSGLKVVWFPSREVLNRAKQYVRVMAHELVHIKDQEGWWKALRFGVMYFFPQWLGPLGFLGFFEFMEGGPAMWPFFILLVCFGPLPAPGRVHLEMRGYAVSIASWKWLGGSVLVADEAWIEEHCAGIIENFVGGGYYWMSSPWGRKSVIRQLKRWIERINDGSIDERIPIAADLRAIMTGR